MKVLLIRGKSAIFIAMLPNDGFPEAETHFHIGLTGRSYNARAATVLRQHSGRARFCARQTVYPASYFEAQLLPKLAKPYYIITASFPKGNPSFSSICSLKYFSGLGIHRQNVAVFFIF
ncbi:MAG: hypothetical protein H6558_15505 [Lewinellaceae bacterium]|nr:hypothetical protein [Lewinellaceae bacterium]